MRRARRRTPRPPGRAEAAKRAGRRPPGPSRPAAALVRPLRGPRSSPPGRRRPGSRGVPTGKITGTTTPVRSARDRCPSSRRLPGPLIPSSTNAPYRRKKGCLLRRHGRTIAASRRTKSRRTKPRDILREERSSVRPQNLRMNQNSASSKGRHLTSSCPNADKLRGGARGGRWTGGSTGIRI